MTDFKAFQAHLAELTRTFDRNLSYYKTGTYNELSARLEYLDPLFTSLGWDVNNSKRVAPHAREVVVENRTEIAGANKWADYVFKIGGINKWVCEAKKPWDNLARRQNAFQIQNYVFNLRVWIGLLTDFEFFLVYIVGARPNKDRPFDPVPNWNLHYTTYGSNARRIWDLFQRDNVAQGSLDQFAQEQPKVISRKIKQGWLIKPDRTRTVDNDFLAFLENERAALGKALVKDNPSFGWEQSSITEAVQRTIDRILFWRICEDREIDTHVTLQTILDRWEAGGERSRELWSSVVGNFRQLRRTFNGGLYGESDKDEHFSEKLNISDRWLSDFLEELSDPESSYLFSTMPVEILGSVYERFLGSIVKANGNVEPKPEVRKAGGVYYTPELIVDFIVEHTVGAAVRGKSPKELSRLKILDPACGSGSFLLRAFERVCEHYVEWYLQHEQDRHEDICYVDRHGDLHLTTGFKRRVLLQNIYGVDKDPQAVEVTQMSLYLKVLEGETRQSLEHEKRLFPKQALLPDLSQNIKCGNSLIGMDALDGFCNDPDVAQIIRPFDWNAEFGSILKRGRFDILIGNPPYVRPHNISPGEKEYFWKHYDTFVKKSDLYCCFVERSVALLGDQGHFGMILSDGWLRLDSFEALRKFVLGSTSVEMIVDFTENVFDQAAVKTCILIATKGSVASNKISVAAVAGAHDLLSVSFRQIPQRAFCGTYKNIFDLSIDPDVTRVKHQIEQGTAHLAEFADISFGIKTGDDSKFISQSADTPKH